MTITEAFKKLKDILEKEKAQLDYMVKGAELLVSILTKHEKENERQQKQPIERSEPGVEQGEKEGRKSK